MTAAAHSDLEVQLGRTLTAQIAPDELPYFDEVVAAMAAPPAKRRDNPLGFGVGDIGSVSAVLLVLCKPILDFIWENAKDSAGQLIKDAGSAARVAFENKLTQWMGRKLQKPAPITLPPEKLEHFIDSIKRESMAIGLDQAASSRLTAALRECFT
jgi:hypothetical protein